MLSERRTASGPEPRTPRSWNSTVDPCRSPGALGPPRPVRRPGQPLTIDASARRIRRSRRGGGILAVGAPNVVGSGTPNPALLELDS